MRLDNNQKAFIALVKGGLWEEDVWLSQLGKVDFNEVYLMAREQSVIGLVAAGLEHVVDIPVPKDEVLAFVGTTLQIERQNKVMNAFVAELFSKMQKADVLSLLVKGQGIAQCYERPMWRTAGDVDLFLDTDNYERAKALLLPIASRIESEYDCLKHQGMTIGTISVELHGTLRSRLSKRIDKVIDSVQEDTFLNNHYRIWRNGDTAVLLPSVDNDVIFVFTHILHHFFIEGVGLRQVCDWCRLLWIYRTEINHKLLESRLKEMHLMSEWKSFGYLAVKILGLPIEAMPLYETLPKWKRKAEKVLSFIIETGSFGHKRNTANRKNVSFVQRKAQSLWRHTCDNIRQIEVFPVDAIRVWWRMMATGASEAIKGNG